MTTRDELVQKAQRIRSDISGMEMKIQRIEHAIASRRGRLRAIEQEIQNGGTHHSGRRNRNDR